MTKRRHTPLTPEQRRERAKEMHDQIAGQVENLRSSQEWTRYLDFVGSFHHYSLANIMLIRAQCPHATHVAGFRQWIERGRSVRKGERAIKIRGFSTKKVEREDGEEDKIVIYPILSVFDISQTDLMAGQIDARPARHLVGTDEQNIGDRVVELLRARGWNVQVGHAGGANGYADMQAKVVVLAGHLTAAQRAKTLLHEAAHVVLHAEIEDYRTHRGIYETEAESVAYVLGGLLGLDTSDYSIGYIANWSHGNAEMIKETAANVLRAVHDLADALTPATVDLELTA
jgi:antirestriction protein ArdC